jgi:TonB family protein
MSMSSAKAVAVSAPRPEYPYEARRTHATGSGVCVMTVDVASGAVTDASMATSTGNSALDNAATSAFRRWRFKPGTVSKVRTPITFTMTGAQF